MAEEEKVVNTENPTNSEATEQEAPVVEPEVPAVQEKEQFIPKSRFDEVNDERNSLREQNRLLIEMQRNQRQPAPEPEQEYLDPAVKSLAEKNRRLEMAIGGVANQLDLIEAKTNPAFKDYAKHEADIERVHSQYLQQGQFIKRSLIYTHLKGQEALKGGSRQVEKVVVEPEVPAAIPQTRPSAKPIKSNKPETLEQTVARLKDVPI